MPIILDKKTIKKLSFETRSSGVGRIRRFQWHDYYALLAIPKGDRTDNTKRMIKNFRNLIKYKTSRLFLKHDEFDYVKTFITINTQTGYPVNVDNKKEGYKYLLGRIKEKLGEHRNMLRTPTLTDVSTPYGMVQLIGGVHRYEGTFLEFRIHGLENVPFTPKTPLSHRGPYLGLELEFFIPMRHRELAKKLRNYATYINIKDDGSIEIDDDLIQYECDDHGEYNCDECGTPDSNWVSVELNILVLESEAKQVITGIVEILNKYDARVNETCGFHVHLDMRERSRRKVFKNLVACQDLLFNLVDDSRGDNTYCERVGSDNLDEVESNHYAAINAKDAYQKFKTIEVRIHQGTVNLKEILSWTDLLTRIANYDGEIVHTQEIGATISLNEETRKHYAI